MKRFFIVEVGTSYTIGPYRRLRHARRDMRALNAWWMPRRSYKIQ